MAAGKGTRFAKLGSYLQKCMYPLGLKPFLEFSISNVLRSQALDLSRDRLVLIVGHHAEQIRAYFADSYKGLAISYLYQEEQLGTGHALYLAYQQLKQTEPVIAWLADTYVSTELFDEICRHTAPNVQTVGPGQEGEKADLKITTLGEKVIQAWQGQEPYYDMGLWKLSPEVLSLMTQEKHGEYRIVPNLQYAIDKGHELGFIKAREWLHLGGTRPSPEANVLAVVKRVLELEAYRDCH